MRMYATFEFILAPTFLTYLEVMEFAKHAGVIDRDDEDTSPRRPLTWVRSLSISLEHYC